MDLAVEASKKVASDAPNTKNCSELERKARENHRKQMFEDKYCEIKSSV